MAAVGLVGGLIKADFMVPYGLVLAVFGVVYLAAFIGTRGVSDNLAFRVGQALGAVGAVVFLVALGRSLFGPASFLIPQGVLLMALGLAYVGVALLACSDWPLVVLTRRELGAFFYSPIAYFVLFGFTLAAGLNFLSFVGTLQRAAARGQPVAEPIVQYYSYSLWPVMSIIIAVPVLTMRLLSEEQRSGTLEVLLTAPVGEVTVVLS